MVRKLLALIPQYRALSVENERLRETVSILEREKTYLNDRLDASLQDRQALWETLRESLREERAAYQAHVNLSWQRMGAGVPYPDQAHAPDRQAHTEAYGRGGRQLPSETVRKKTAEFVSGIFKAASGE